MMKPGVPWSVKGIGPEAREAAKAAARHSGMTVGEWLNSIILDRSDQWTKPASDLLPRSDAGAGALHNRLASVAEQLEQLSDPAAGNGCRPLFRGPTSLAL